MRSVAGALVLASVVLLVAGWAGAAPPPPAAKFRTASRCESVLHTQDWGALTADGYGFHIGLAVCVGTGGPSACMWTSDRRSRLYSEFTVFSRARYIGGIVRSWTLATRARHGFVREGRRYPASWPAAYYMAPASVRLLATNSTPAGFRSIVTPLAARLTQQETATGCTGS